MAIAQGTSTVTVSSQERTWRVNIETPLGLDPTVTIQREEVKTDENGVVISKKPNAVVSRSLSSTAAQSFTVNGMTITIGELATVIAAVADAWRTEDIANPPAATL